MNQPLLITGATGTLGTATARICDIRGLQYVATKRTDLELSSRASVYEVVRRLNPWAVINTAGYVRVDDAERDQQTCFRENAEGAANLAMVCADLDIPLVTFSSDLVFDGRRTRPYLESDPVAPLSVYGRSKVEAEQRVIRTAGRALVIRTAAFFGPWDRHNFLVQTLAAARLGQPLVVADDMVVSPTYVPDLVHAVLDLLIDGESGVWHLANEGCVTWAEFALLGLNRAGLDASRVYPTPTTALNFAAPRPAFSPLGSERGVLLGSLEDAVDRFCEAVRASL